MILSPIQQFFGNMCERYRELQTKGETENLFVNFSLLHSHISIRNSIVLFCHDLSIHTKS